MKIITSLLLVLSISFPLVATNLDTDPEDPNKFEKYKDTYPQDCPECLGQISGACMYCHPLQGVSMGLLSLYSGVFFCSLCPQYLIPETLLGISFAITTGSSVSHGCYNYARRSGRDSFADRADFARTCSADDPLSVVSCLGSIKNNCCIPTGDFLYESGSRIKKTYYDLKSSTIEFLSPGVSALSGAIWNCCMGDCLNFLCGSGADQRKKS
jgi:hypothetical protein